MPVLADTHVVEPVPLSAVYRHGKHRMPKVRAFLDFLVRSRSRQSGSTPFRSSPLSVGKRAVPLQHLHENVVRSCEVADLSFQLVLPLHAMEEVVATAFLESSLADPTS